MLVATSQNFLEFSQDVPFQSLIGINVSCNLLLEIEADIEGGFQSLIGINVSCNWTEFRGTGGTPRFNP